MKTSYSVLGAMAGSSMDGLDLSLVRFNYDNSWKYLIESCETISYPRDLYHSLSQASSYSMELQKKLDISFGNWIAQVIRGFLKERRPDLLAVHGHTVTHAPRKKISWQLGDGKQIAFVTGIPTVTEFRSLDVENGGQGAPLVPFGDFNLFSEYDACLNLGGIANVSISATQSAWDICPCNQVLNYYANKLGRAYDNRGALSRSGEIDATLYARLEEISFFNQQPPKSLPNSFIPVSVLDSTDPIIGLRTYTEFISRQIARDLSMNKPGKLLITGGGAFNTFLIEEIKKHLSKWDIVLPDTSIISYKEALIFAFLGLKKMRGEINVLRSVTGAAADSSSGVIHVPE